MVRVCLADTDLQALVNGLVQSRLPVEVGLVVGRASNGQRFFVLGFVPCPDTSDGRPIRTRLIAAPGKGKTQTKTEDVELDEDWICEHARHVGRMLPGGLQVLGTFFFGSEAAFQQSNSSLSRLACACVEISSPAIAEDGSSGTECAIPPVVFFADSKSKKMSVKVCEPTGSQQPAELKWMSLADSFIPLSCDVAVDISLPAGSKASTVGRLLKGMAVSEQQRIMASRAMLGGRLPRGDTPMVDLATAGGAEALQVTLLRPVSGGSPRSATSGHAKGLAAIQGTIHARAYAYKRETWEAAVEQLKRDAASSLLTRIELLLEDEDESAEEVEEGKQREAGGGAEAQARAPLLTEPGSLSTAHTLHMPRRVAFSWRHGIQLCGYMYSDEDEEGFLQQAGKLLAMDTADAALVEWERPADVSPAAPEWRPGLAPGEGAAAARPAASSSSCSMVALMVLAGAAGLASSALVMYLQR